LSKNRKVFSRVSRQFEHECLAFLTSLTTLAQLRTCRFLEAQSSKHITALIHGLSFAFNRNIINFPLKLKNQELVAFFYHISSFWIFLMKFNSGGVSLVLCFLLSSSMNLYSTKNFVSNSSLNTDNWVFSEISSKSCHSPFLSVSKISSTPSNTVFSAVHRSI